MIGFFEALNSFFIMTFFFGIPAGVLSLFINPLEVEILKGIYVIALFIVYYMVVFMRKYREKSEYFKKFYPKFLTGVILAFGLVFILAGLGIQFITFLKDCYSEGSYSSSSSSSSGSVPDWDNGDPMLDLELRSIYENGYFTQSGDDVFRNQAWDMLQHPERYDDSEKRYMIMQLQERHDSNVRVLANEIDSYL